LTAWLEDGRFMSCPPAGDWDTEVSIGRTGSKQALGFTVEKGDTKMDFVLDQEQVAFLAEYFGYSLPRLLKSKGPKGPSFHEMLAEFEDMAEPPLPAKRRGRK
jgi:hypothetical protein